MSLALIGLVAFQAYWLGFMLETKKEQFAADIRSSMDLVIRKLEKQELVVLAQRQKDLEIKQDRLANIAVKLARKPPKKIQKIQDFTLNPTDVISDNVFGEFLSGRDTRFQPENPNDVFYVRKSVLLPNGQIAEITEEYQVNRDPLMEQRRKIDAEMRQFRQEQELDQIFGTNSTKIVREFNRLKNRNLNRMALMQHKSQRGIDLLKKRGNEKISKLNQNLAKEKAEKIELEKVLKKSQMAKEVFADFLFKERPIEQRLSPHFIDSLLKKELANKNILLPFVFGIGTKPNPAIRTEKHGLEWTYTSTPIIREAAFQKAAFLAPLFPNDLRNSGQWLHVYFPGQQQFIWQTMGFSFLGSVLLLLIMLGCFYIAVNTILKQKKLAEIKNDFINNMTHEFKTPISTISLATQLIQEEPLIAKNESILKYLGIIKEENLRLGNQVERVLQTAQMEREEIILKRKPVDFNALVRQVADMIDPTLKAASGQLHLDLLANPSVISLDEVHISNVLNNLIDNAIKYSKEFPDLVIHTKSTENELILQVQDQGIGMNKEFLSAIFEPFYRIPTGNVHNVKGFGLGLSYVKKIIDAHGGNVKVTSEVGVGSVFEIKLAYGTNK